MKDKINIAELLKNCPKGMELDCTMFDNLVFSEIDPEGQNYTIITQLPNGAKKWFTSDGRYEVIPSAKCVIFPKGRNTWEGFVPPCKFKDGDVISNSLDTCIFKGEGRIKGTVDYYCGVHTDYFIVKDNKSNPDGHYGNIVDYRLATEEEKEKLFDAIKENGYKWNAETKTLEKLFEPKFKVGDRIKCVHNNYQYDIIGITDTHYTLEEVENKYKYTEPIIEDKYWELVRSKFDINTLVPFESRVLVRNVGAWEPAFWGYYSKEYAYPFVVAGCNTFAQCIPYEGNEHLLGKTDDCSEYYKTWE